MNGAGKTMIMGGILAFFVVFAAKGALEDKLERVRSGDLILHCVMHDGEREIPPSRVVDMIDGVWVFNNGSASNCTTRRG